MVKRPNRTKNKIKESELPLSFLTPSSLALLLKAAGDCL
jgi:hypothetical protein